MAEKSEFGCPLAFRKFGYVCTDCGHSDFSGPDLCASPADRQAMVAALRGGRDPESLDPMGAQNHPLPPKAERPPEPVLELPKGAPRVIGLCGLAGSGKSTAAEFLEGCGYTRLRFADPLKAMVDALLEAAGVWADQRARMIEGDLKEVAQGGLGGRTPRYVMQTLGTEWGRDLIGADFWTSLARRRAWEVLDAGGRVVFEDVRFVNEAEVVRQLHTSAAVWQLKGRAAQIAAAGAVHPSERLEVEPDLVLDNSWGLEALEVQIVGQLLG